MVIGVIGENFRDIEHTLKLFDWKNLLRYFIFILVGPFNGAPALKFKNIQNKNHSILYAVWQNWKHCNWEKRQFIHRDPIYRS